MLPSVADLAAALAIAELCRGRCPARYRPDGLNHLRGAPGHAPNAVGLALAAPPMDQLDGALRTLVAILIAREDDFYWSE